jgi:hypothetical protein
MEDNLKKMQPYFDQTSKTTSKKWKKTSKINKNGRQPQAQYKKINLNWL